MDTASASDKLFHELLLDAAACHLIEDWKGIAVPDENGEPKDFIYTTENAKKLLNEGDIGPVIWLFVKTNAEQIQREADEVKAETLGKSENSMSGQKSAAKSEPVATRKSRTTSAKQTQ